MRWLLFFRCNSDQKQYLLEVGMFSVLQDILDGFIHNAGVIMEALCVIACLSDLCTYVQYYI